jgi:hypothetical protein
LPDFMQVNTAMQVTTKQQWKRTVWGLKFILIYVPPWSYTRMETAL